MVSMVILRKDATTYWEDSFQDIATANKWVAEEQTRPYWDKSYTVTLTDHALEEAAAAAANARALAAANAALDLKKTAIIAARAKGAGGRTPAEAQALLDLLVDFLGIT